MTTADSKVTIHMVSSLDFFIAKKGDESFSWLESSDTYEKGVTGEDAEEFAKTIGCYVMGSRTYEQAFELGWPYGDVPVFVLTHRDLSSDRGSVSFYSGDLKKFVDDQLKPSYENIWVVGGRTVARDFINSNLADDIRITIAPILTNFRAALPPRYAEGLCLSAQQAMTDRGSASVTLPSQTMDLEAQPQNEWSSINGKASLSAHHCGRAARSFKNQGVV